MWSYWVEIIQLDRMRGEMKIAIICSNLNQRATLFKFVELLTLSYWSFQQPLILSYLSAQTMATFHKHESLRQLSTHHIPTSASQHPSNMAMFVVELYMHQTKSNYTTINTIPQKVQYTLLIKIKIEPLSVLGHLGLDSRWLRSDSDSPAAVTTVWSNKVTSARTKGRGGGVWHGQQERQQHKQQQNNRSDDRTSAIAVASMKTIVSCNMTAIEHSLNCGQSQCGGDIKGLRVLKSHADLGMGVMLR